MSGAAAQPRLAFSGSKLLVSGEDHSVEVPDASLLNALGVVAVSTYELSTVSSGAAAIELPEPFAPPDGMHLRGLRSLYGALAEETFALAGRAFQLVEWGRNARFCGRCGAPTQRSERDFALACSACGRLHFPRISPAVIVQVTREPDEILLGRSLRAPPGCYSVLAGFVEPGESLEQTVAREIREEVGLEVADVRYFGSQPWPFPDSLMVAFTARYASGELTADPAELSDAGWFTAAGLPPVPPGLSIARALIDDFVVRSGLDPTELAEWPI